MFFHAVELEPLVGKFAGTDRRFLSASSVMLTWFQSGYWKPGATSPSGSLAISASRNWLYFDEGCRKFRFLPLTCDRSAMVSAYVPS